MHIQTRTPLDEARDALKAADIPTYVSIQYPGRFVMVPPEGRRDGVSTDEIIAKAATLKDISPEHFGK